MRLNIQRFTLTGSEHAFVFDKERSQYVVKNFTEDDVYVSFEQGAPQNESIKIPTMMGQVCFLQDTSPSSNVYSTNVIYVTGTGEVEVQQI